MGADCSGRPGRAQARAGRARAQRVRGSLRSPGEGGRANASRSFDPLNARDARGANETQMPTRTTRTGPPLRRVFSKGPEHQIGGFKNRRHATDGDLMTVEEGEGLRSLAAELSRREPGRRLQGAPPVGRAGAGADVDDAAFSRFREFPIFYTGQGEGLVAECAALLKNPCKHATPSSRIPRASIAVRRP